MIHDSKRHSYQTRWKLQEDICRYKQSRRVKRESLRLLFLSNMIPSKGYLMYFMPSKYSMRNSLPLHADFIGRWQSDEHQKSFMNDVAEHKVENVITAHGAEFICSSNKNQAILPGRENVFLLNVSPDWKLSRFQFWSDQCRKHSGSSHNAACHIRNTVRKTHRKRYSFRHVPRNRLLRLCETFER